MKKYEKPQVKPINVVTSEELANSGLASWMEGNELMEQGITTYSFVS